MKPSAPHKYPSLSELLDDFAGDHFSDFKTKTDPMTQTCGKKKSQERWRLGKCWFYKSWSWIWNITERMEAVSRHSHLLPPLLRRALQLSRLVIFGIKQVDVIGRVAHKNLLTILAVAEGRDPARLVGQVSGNEPNTHARRPPAHVVTWGWERACGFSTTHNVLNTFWLHLEITAHNCSNTELIASKKASNATWIPSTETCSTVHLWLWCPACVCRRFAPSCPSSPRPGSTAPVEKWIWRSPPSDSLSGCPEIKAEQTLNIAQGKCLHHWRV